MNDLTLSNIALYNYSALRYSTSRDYYDTESGKSLLQLQVALYYNNCANVVMESVHVNHSTNATGVVMYNTNSRNIISDSMFNGNSVSSPMEMWALRILLEGEEDFMSSSRTAFRSNMH